MSANVWRTVLAGAPDSQTWEETTGGRPPVMDQVADEVHASAAAHVPRFVLIDHSISGEGGHHLEYARHALEAAERAGLQPVLATNRAFKGGSELIWPAHPL